MSNEELWVFVSPQGEADWSLSTTRKPGSKPPQMSVELRAAGWTWRHGSRRFDEGVRDEVGVKPE